MRAGDGLPAECGGSAAVLRKAELSPVYTEIPRRRLTGGICRVTGGIRRASVVCAAKPTCARGDEWNCSPLEIRNRIERLGDRDAEAIQRSNERMQCVELRDVKHVASDRQAGRQVRDLKIRVVV